MSLFPSVIPGESDLSVTRTDLQQALALSRGWDLTVGSWQADETAQANIVLKGAERRFYGAHHWSFLMPTVPLTMTADVEVYDLPDDFLAMEGPMYYTGSYAGQSPITRASLGITSQYRDGTTTGTPKYYAIEPLAHTGEQIGQRFAVHFDVKPSSAFTLQATYRRSGYATSTDRPYPLGGQATAEALRFAVMAQGEIELGQGPGRYSEQFERLLAEAIAEDLRKGPTYLGKNLTRNRSGMVASTMYPVRAIFHNGIAVE